MILLYATKYDHITELPVMVIVKGDGDFGLRCRI